MSAVVPTCGDAGGRTKDGAPCTSTIVLEAGLCHFHDPARAESARLARAAGARASGDIARLATRIKQTAAPKDLPAFPPDSLERVAQWHMWTVRSVSTGEIDFKVAREITTALRELRPVLINIGFEKRLKQYQRAVVSWKRTGKPDQLLALVGTP